MSKPKVRIHGFSGDWNETQLKDFTSRVVRKNTGLQSTLPLTVSAQYGLIGQDSFFNSRIASTNIEGYYLLKKGEFAYNKSSSQGYPYGAVKRLDLHENGVLSTLYIVFNIDKDKVDSDYIVSYFDASTWHNEVRLRAAEGARNHGLLNISAEDFFDIKILLPESITEQQAIGAFFKLLSQNITNLTDKITSLKSLKICYLSRLFPIGGGYEPSIRLKGFTGPWKRQKLEELLTIREDTAGEKYTKEDVLSVSGDYGVVNQIEFQGRSFAGASISNYRVVNKGNVVYTKSPLKASPYGIIKTAKKEEGIVSPLYAVYDPKDNCDPDFVQTYFENKDRLNLYLRPLVNKGAKNTLLISDEGALQGEVVFPEKEEQKAITEFFTQLDGLIRLHEEELEKLKSLKQSCLAGMFV